MTQLDEWKTPPDLIYLQIKLLRGEIWVLVKEIQDTDKKRGIKPIKINQGRARVNTGQAQLLPWVRAH